MIWKWYDMIWYDAIRYDMIWYDMTYILWLLICSRLISKTYITYDSLFWGIITRWLITLVLFHPARVDLMIPTFNWRMSLWRIHPLRKKMAGNWKWWCLFKVKSLDSLLFSHFMFRLQKPSNLSFPCQNPPGKTCVEATQIGENMNSWNPSSSVFSVLDIVPVDKSTYHPQ